MTSDNDTPPATTLAVAALGIVFGDIGTSPLYALKACFSGFHAVPVNEANILGVLSLVFWSLTVVISIKYVMFVMRAHNRGEGGIIALYSLLPEQWIKSRKWALVLALFGAALLYGDGFITPAISVLSALEGLSVVTAKADPYVVPLTCLVLAGLFLIQRQGTHRIGRIFGPVMLVWFCTLAALGGYHLLHNPGVLAAVRPWHAINFFLHNGSEATIVLGAVVLCITGGEALYADMGHFGLKPIRLAWYAVAMPALLINYFGQGALLLSDPGAMASPFYGLAPRPLLIPLVALSTCATIIASQAVISGVFSLTRQAIQFDFLPRAHILHTSAESEGQVYCPPANWAMAVICLLLVVGFKSSDNLAGAYGIAITSTMCITTALYFIYVRQVRKWPWWSAGLLCAVFLTFDLGFFGANLAKLEGGGWIPLTAAGILCLSMLTWSRGRAATWQLIREYCIPIRELSNYLETNDIQRTKGTAVILSMSPREAPPVLIHFVRLTQTLKENVILLSVVTEPVPTINEEDRLVVKILDNGISRVVARYGFAESPNLQLEMRRLETLGVIGHAEDAVYYLGRESIITHKRRAIWKTWYALMKHTSMSPHLYFRIPPKRVIEIGMQIEL